MMPLPSMSNQQSSSSSAGFHKNGESNFEFGNGDWNVNYGSGSTSSAKTTLPGLPKSQNAMLLLLVAVAIVAWMKYR